MMNDCCGRVESGKLFQCISMSSPSVIITLDQISFCGYKIVSPWNKRKFDKGNSVIWCITAQPHSHIYFCRFQVFYYHSMKFHLFILKKRNITFSILCYRNNLCSWSSLRTFLWSCSYLLNVKLQAQTCVERSRDYELLLKKNFWND